VTPGDAARVLAACMMFDGRSMPEEDDMADQLSLAWYTVIGDLERDEAIEAVRRHYMISRKWAMPVDIRDGVAAIRKERQAVRPPHEIRALPSKFEKDVDKAAGVKRGISEARTALERVFETMALRDGSPAAMTALEELRQITAQREQAADENEGGTRK
jgi:hypothetical protein